MATTAIPKPGAVTMVDAIRQAMTEEMERDAAVVAIGEDIGVYGGAFKVTDGLLAKFGRERVIERYQLDRTVEEYFKLYSRLAGR